MSTLILDTNIVSYLMRGGALARGYQPHVQEYLLAISKLLVGLKALLTNQRTSSGVAVTKNAKPETINSTSPAPPR